METCDPESTSKLSLLTPDGVSQGTEITGLVTSALFLRDSQNLPSDLVLETLLAESESDMLEHIGVT